MSFDRARAIPTCVGTTARLGHMEAMLAGHPHVRGDYGELGGGG